MPWADVVYGCDARWWDLHGNCNDFAGELWSTHDKANNKKDDVNVNLNLVRGEHASTFSLDPGGLHYGSNSGFQAIGLAILLGCEYIVLVGYDMSHRGKGHFFGEHPAPLYQQNNYESFIGNFEIAAKHLPDNIRIVNATPDSKLTCFPMMPLEDAVANHRLHWDRTKPAA